jgi:glucose-1-phosphate cytidylyltransferase
MKVVILAGGLGTRLSEETTIKPKPMVEIGGMPILWHLMKIYSYYGFNEFIICLGYKGYYIKEFFSNYFLHKSDVTIDLLENKIEVHRSSSEPWKVTLIDTGFNTMTGGRILRIKDYIKDESFMVTYGDGIGNIDLKKLLNFHKEKKTIATLTTVMPTGRFGALKIDNNNIVTEFTEKPRSDGSWVNAGFFVLEPQIFNYLENDSTIFEKHPLESLAKENQLSAFRHNGFWMPMDKLSDKKILEEIWDSDKALWKIWE